MKKVLSFIILVAISTGIFAQTEVEGNQSGSWTIDNSPYNVIGDITVSSGDVLIIESGVEVNFQGYYKFNVTGNLQAVGTDNPETGWGGIRVDVDNGDDIIALSYCRIEYGKTAGEYPDFNGGGLALFTSNAIISNCVFADNTANTGEYGSGGAIYAINSGDIEGETLTTITDCKFIGNNCYGEGGAIKFTSDGYTEITNCEFVENDCLYGGGAISLYSVVGTKMTNCLFADNYTMYASGGAIHMLGMGNLAFFENCTITGNEAVTGDGGGVYIVNGTVDFVNCIAYNNSAAYGGTQGDNIYVNPDGSTAEINYCNLIMPEYGATGANNINEDPLFVDATNGDFHLQETSTCIDAGTDIGLPYFGVAPDLGCYELGLLQAPYAITYSPNPNVIYVELATTVSLTFNEDITEIDFSSIEIKDATNTSVTGVSAVLEDDNRTITISHDEFNEEEVYTVIIPENSVQNSDLIGNDEITWNFTTGIIDNILEQNSKITIYPNPTNGIINLSGLQNLKGLNFEITDISGKIVQNFKTSELQNLETIDISELNSGIYFIKIQTENEIFTNKIIKN